MRKKVLLFTIFLLAVMLLLAAVISIKQSSDQNNLNEVKLTNELPVKDKTGLPAAPENDVQSTKDLKIASEDNGNISKSVSTDQKSISNTVDKNKTAGATDDDLVLTFSIAVIGKNKEIIYGPSKVSVASEEAESISVLNVLDATGLNYETSSRWPELVEVISGLGNKGQSGWMYAVNDQIPMVSAAAKKVREDDRIIWWYSEDIKAKFPLWKDLTASKQSTS
ncbi:MAG: DUF4430 domain-containing protein [Eubacteriales bacterium]|jgi:hypothetical protein